MYLITNHKSGRLAYATEGVDSYSKAPADSDQGNEIVQLSFGQCGSRRHSSLPGYRATRAIGARGASDRRGLGSCCMSGALRMRKKPDQPLFKTIKIVSEFARRTRENKLAVRNHTDFVTEAADFV